MKAEIVTGGLWPIAEGFVFPKLDVQAAALEKSSRSAAAATPDPKQPLAVNTHC